MKNELTKNKVSKFNRVKKSAGKNINSEIVNKEFIRKAILVLLPNIWMTIECFLKSI